MIVLALLQKMNVNIQQLQWSTLIGTHVLYRYNLLLNKGDFCSSQGSDSLQFSDQRPVELQSSITFKTKIDRFLGTGGIKGYACRVGKLLTEKGSHDLVTW